MSRTSQSSNSLFTRLYLNLFPTPQRRASRGTHKIASAPAAVLEQRVLLVAFQNFDGVAAPALPVGWTQTATAANTWSTVAGGADAGANRAFVAGIASVSDSSLTSPSVFIDGANGRLSFRHSFDLNDTNFDGGVLEISIAGGAFKDIIAAGGTFVAGGYSGTLNASGGNPLAKRSAWFGNSGGYITTTVDVPAAAIGQNVQFRWRLGTDSSVASSGWSLDTISLDQLPDPDDQISEATNIAALNTTVSGVLDNKLDVDMFKFTVTAGQTLQFDLDTQGIPIALTDSVLRVFNAAGTQLAANDDAVGWGPEGPLVGGFNRESYLQYTFAAAGTYYVGVSGFDNSAYNATTGTGDVFSNEDTGGYSLNIGTAPAVTSIVLSNPNLREHGTSTVTFTFDQPVTAFTNADLTVENGTLTPVASADGGVTWTATFTPTPNIIDATNVITVNTTTLTDLVGTPGTNAAVLSPNYTIDTIVDENDQISEAGLVLLNTTTNAAIDKGLDVDMYAFSVVAGQTVYFDLDTQGFATPLTDSYIRLFNAAGTQLASDDDSDGFGAEGNGLESYMKYTFASSGTYYIGVSGFDNTAYSATTGDGDANSLLTGSYLLHIGTAPTATIAMSNTNLLPGQTALVTFTFSEPVIGFTNADLTVQNGTLTAVASADGGTTWTATFTPTPGVIDDTNVITLDNTGFTDSVGTPGYEVGGPGSPTTVSANYKIGPAFNSAQLVADPYVPGQLMLLVNGTNGDDVINVTKASATTYNVTINGVNKGTFAAQSRIVVLGQNGNDKITVASNVTLPSLLDGGNDNDVLSGGGSKSIMLGGAGNDTLTGFGVLVGGADNDILKSTAGKTVMIGGAGIDSLTSQFGNDILIGGTTDHDADPVALTSILAEWNAATSVSTRIAHLAGLAGGGLNGAYLLVSDAVRPGTVHNDFASDTFTNNNVNDWLLPFSGDKRTKIIGQVNHA